MSGAPPPFSSSFFRNAVPAARVRGASNAPPPLALRPRKRVRRQVVWPSNLLDGKTEGDESKGSGSSSSASASASSSTGGKVSTRVTDWMLKQIPLIKPQMMTAVLSSLMPQMSKEQLGTLEGLLRAYGPQAFFPTAGTAELPERLVFHVMQFLDLRDLVRARRVSQSWKTIARRPECLTDLVLPTFAETHAKTKAMIHFMTWAQAQVTGMFSHVRRLHVNGAYTYTDLRFFITAAAHSLYRLEEDMTSGRRWVKPSFSSPLFIHVLKNCTRLQHLLVQWPMYPDRKCTPYLRSFSQLQSVKLSNDFRTLIALAGSALDHMLNGTPTSSSHINRPSVSAITYLHLRMESAYHYDDVNGSGYDLESFKIADETLTKIFRHVRSNLQRLDLDYRDSYDRAGTFEHTVLLEAGSLPSLKMLIIRHSGGLTSRTYPPRCHADPSRTANVLGPFLSHIANLQRVDIQCDVLTQPVLWNQVLQPLSTLAQLHDVTLRDLHSSCSLGDSNEIWAQFVRRLTRLRIVHDYLHVTSFAWLSSAQSLTTLHLLTALARCVTPAAIDSHAMHETGDGRVMMMPLPSLASSSSSSSSMTSASSSSSATTTTSVPTRPYLSAAAEEQLNEAFWTDRCVELSKAPVLSDVWMTCCLPIGACTKYWMASPLPLRHLRLRQMSTVKDSYLFALGLNATITHLTMVVIWEWSPLRNKAHLRDLLNGTIRKTLRVITLQVPKKQWKEDENLHLMAEELNAEYNHGVHPVRVQVAPWVHGLEEE